jgi:hypothetical protein
MNIEQLLDDKPAINCAMKLSILEHLPYKCGTGPFELYPPYHLTGSAFICPNATPADFDFIVNAEGDMTEIFERLLMADGYVCAGHQHEYPDDMTLIMQKFVDPPFNKIKVDIIICIDDEHYQKWMRATLLARELNLKEKADRKTLFRAICDDVWGGI